MTVFPDWQKYAVPQRNPLTGCIPTGYEIILRARGIDEINFTNFQEQFDLDKDLPEGTPQKNNFQSVAAAVNKAYSQVHFEIRQFPQGKGVDKLRFIEQQIVVHRPVLVSLFVGVHYGRICYHIMSVIDADAEHLFLLYSFQTVDNYSIMTIRKDLLVQLHNSISGGDDVAFLP